MRIFTATAWAYLMVNEPDDKFFSRDMGLACHALRQQNIDSMVVMPGSSEAKQHPDIIRASLEDMEHPNWWAQYNLDAVVLGAWADPQYTLIAKAIKDSGAKVIVRCDCGTQYSQWQKTLWQSLYENYLVVRYRDKGFLYACLFSMLKTPIYYYPGIYVKKMIKHMSYADLIMNETPEGVYYLKSLLSHHGEINIAARVKYVPHPIANEAGYSLSCKKEKRIIAVGRWDNYSKNTYMLIRTLAEVLMKHNKYEFHIFGSGESIIKKMIIRLSPAITSRIHIHGLISNNELGLEYQKSRIFFSASRSESFGIAAAEALCCGCSIVASNHIFSFKNFASKNSGTLAEKYTVNAMRKAIEIELSAWDNGLRDPVRISEQWCDEVSTKKMINEITRVVSS